VKHQQIKILYSPFLKISNWILFSQHLKKSYQTQNPSNQSSNLNKNYFTFIRTNQVSAHHAPLAMTSPLNKPIRIGVLTSGGDAPGMNPAVRAVVRAALKRGADVYAIHEGYYGMVFGGELIQKMKWDDVSGTIQQVSFFVTRCLL
jgi:hypothetical protein